MANFDDHIRQAKGNLSILSEFNNKIANGWDWQVTIAYYIAVHLMNAHLAKKANLHYKTHEQVKNALFSATSVGKIPEDVYLSYVKLEGLSRRSRYLCHENNAGLESLPYLTYDKHFKKALKNLDRILKFFDGEYKISFKAINIDCIEVKDDKLIYFNYLKKTV
ncbi:MAG: hypothetical protein ACHQIM_01975 [Sphingobacteriales bacterium]